MLRAGLDTVSENAAAVWGEGVGRLELLEERKMDEEATVRHFANSSISLFGADRERKLSSKLLVVAEYCLLNVGFACVRARVEEITTDSDAVPWVHDRAALTVA